MHRPEALKRLLPGLEHLRRYERGWLRGDVLAGVTVAAYLVPQVMAYAVIAGLQPVAGLWAITGSLLVYAFIGSSRQLSVGPESTTALMTASAIAPLAAGDAQHYAALAGALALLVGAICLLAWVARLGFLADLLSRPVLVGYMAGVALIMIVGQLSKVTAVDVERGSVPTEVASFVKHIGQTNGYTLALALAVLAILIVGSRLFPNAPVLLIAVLLATAAVGLGDLQDNGIRVVGEIPGGLPRPQVPDVTLADLRALLLPALGVSIVGYTDNVLTARAFAARSRYDIDANTELLALGTANLAAGALHGFPVSSSGSRTAIGDSLGSRSQLYSLIALLVVVASLLFLGPVLASFPTAALGALVIYAALRLIDVADFRRIARFRRSELVLALATVVGVLVADILYGVLIAVGLSVLDVLRRVARPHDGILGYVPDIAGMHDIDDYPTARQVPGLVVYRYDSPLFFANAQDFKRRALSSLEFAETPVEWLILNAEANVEVDLTSIDALTELHSELERRGIVLALARVKQDLRHDLAAAGFLDLVGQDRVFMTLPTAVAAYLRWYTDRHGHGPRGVDVPPPPPSPLGEMEQ
ncbi:MAG TPA: sulfate permease [Kineosporiaceae bacterium]|nr:sulfate permease [Kineosporiaceae bacterium]